MPMSWTAVTDAVPLQDGCKLVTVQDGDRREVITSYWYVKQQMWDAILNGVDVVAWMELPPCYPG